MSTEMQKQVGLESLEKAKIYYANGNYGRAFAHYLVYFQLYPNERSNHQHDFVIILCNWGLFLEEQNRIEDLCKCYIQAMTYFPRSCIILNNFGAHLLRLGEPDAAKRYLQLAYNYDKDFLPTEKHLLAAKLNLIPRWHFRMLNNFTRNIAYRKAIEKAIDKKYNKVLDIGTGCGILSCFASQIPNVQKITAIEQSRALSKIAKNVFKANGANVTLINKYSTDLMNGSVEGNLLVTEIFDNAVFGEHILETLIHAWKFLLDEKDSKVIPSSADIYVSGINCSELYKNYKMTGKIPELQLNDLCVTYKMIEPYEAEDLSLYAVEYLTNTKNIAKINFNDVSQLEDLYSSKYCFPTITLQCVEEGSLQAFAVWFDLHLDETITITTNPFKENVNCWDQALFYLNHPLQLTEGDEVSVKISLEEEQLQMSILNEVDACPNCFSVSQPVVTFLNDNSLVQLIANLSNYFTTSNMVVLDLNCFPLFGLLMAKKGAKVYCQVKSPLDLGLVDYIIRKNNITTCQVVLENEIDSCLETMEQLDILFMIPVTVDGTAHDLSLSDLPVYKKKLKPTGIVLPKTTNVVFEMVNSSYLDSLNKIDDEGTLGLKIAEFFEDTIATEQALIRYDKLPRIKLTKPTRTINIMRNSAKPIVCTIDVSIEATGHANAFLYWFELNFMNSFMFDTRNSSHFHCACFLLKKPKYVTKNDVVNVKFKQHKGFISLYCSDN